MKVAIIGAGYSGLSIAKELVENGQEVTIFEKENYVGGMVNTIDILDTRLEKYYRHIFKSDKEVINLIKEMEIEENLIWPSTKMGYIINNKIYEFGTPISLLKFKELNFLEKIIFGFNIINLKLINNYKKLENVTAEQWLKKRIGNKIYSKIWEPLLLSKFGDEKEKISMVWLWGKIKLRSTSSTNNGEQLGYLKGSYQKLTDSLYQYLVDKKVDIKLKINIKEIKKENKYTIIYNDNDIEDKKQEFDIVVSTIDYKNFVNLFNKYIDEEELQKIKEIEYTAARTMIIVSDISFSPFYWINVGNKDIPFGGIIEHTNLVSKDNYKQNHIIYISNYMTEENKLYKMTKEELLQEYIKYLNKINHNFSMKNIKQCYVFDEQYAQPIIKCNYSNIILDNKLKNENIYICSMPQIYPEDRGMNYAIKEGKNTAKKILDLIQNESKEL